MLLCDGQNSISVNLVYRFGEEDRDRMLAMEIYFWQSQIPQAARILLSLSAPRFDSILFFVDPDTDDASLELSPWKAVDDALAHPNFGNARRVAIYPRFSNDKLPLQHRCMDDVYRILLPHLTNTAPGVFDICQDNVCPIHMSVFYFTSCALTPA